MSAEGRGPDPLLPALDAAGRTPRERGAPVGATSCGCALATWALMHPGGRRCNGCGALLPAGEWALRRAALATAQRCRELARAT